MQVFREAKLRRARRQLATMTRAVGAGRSRAKSQQAGTRVDGESLLQVVSAVGADAELIQVPVNRPPWTPTTIQAEVGDQITWLAWGHVDLLKPLGVVVGPSMGLLCRVGNGKPLDSGGSTRTFTADCDGLVQVAGRAPGWVQDDGSIIVDRVPYRLPYRALTGTLTAPPSHRPGRDLGTRRPRRQLGLQRQRGHHPPPR